MTEITVGFDGSRQRHEGVTDATAIVCVTLDGHVFVPCGGETIWQAPPGPAGHGWEVPVIEVDAAMRSVFSTYDVVGCYCDPNKWESFIAQWEGAFGHRVRVRAGAQHPFTYWPTGRKFTGAVEAFHQAVVGGHLTHDDNPTLTAHIVNARQRPTSHGITIEKEFPSSARKIDGAVAAVLAWQARLDALAHPGPPPTEQFAPRRIR